MCASQKGETAMLKLIVLVVGAVLVTVLDVVMGMRVPTHPFWKNVAHKLVYMIFGAAVWAL